MAKFNQLLDEQYREILDFIVMMYYTSNRDETFWKSARGDIEVPESLLNNLELWNALLKKAEPGIANVPGKLPAHTQYLNAINRPRAGKKALYSVNYGQ